MNAAQKADLDGGEIHAVFDLLIDSFIVKLR